MRNVAAEFYFFIRGFGAWPLAPPLPSARVRGLRERRELPQLGPGQSPDRQKSFGTVEAQRTVLKS